MYHNQHSLQGEADEGSDSFHYKNSYRYGIGSEDYFQPVSPPRQPRRAFSQTSLLSRFRKQAHRMVAVRIVLLDQENFQTEISKSALGRELFDNVKQKLSLEEADYFGLSYRNPQNLRFWLNLEKRIDKQVENARDMVFYWEVKFYPPAPEQLNEDLTRYLVVLQVRQDLFNGRLPASFQTSALLGSYTAQGELGDFEKGTVGVEYLRSYSFAPKQSDELLQRISDIHRTHKGLNPAEADLYFLDNAKKMALYGMELYAVKDSKGRELKVGVSASGLAIYDGKLRMDNIKWPRIIKISWKRNIFYVAVRPGEFEKHKSTHGFKLPSMKLAKRLWRYAVESHQFFRLNQPELTDTRSLGGFGSRRWRMSGRTQAQLKNVGTPRKSYSRSNSIMSSDTFGHSPFAAGTMPLPGNRRDMDSPEQYHTFGDHEPRPEPIYAQPNKRRVKPTTATPSVAEPEEGRAHRGNERFENSYNPNGVPSDENLDDSRMSRNGDSVIRAPPRAAPRNPTHDDTAYGNEDLVNGHGNYDPESGQLAQDSAAAEKSGSVMREPERVKRQPENDYETYDDITRQKSNNVQNSAVPAPRQNGYDPGSQSQSSPTGHIQLAPSKSAFGVGDLPMPLFGLESAGILPTGALDTSVKLDTSERAEKVIRIEVPPTVKTTCMKFNGALSETSTRSTRSPPTVRTEKKQFNYIPDTETMGGRLTHSHRISETTTYTTERDGYTEKRVKHKIIISGDEDINDQLLLEAIQAVTGLDKTLGVDKIEIKTEEEAT